MPNGATSPDFPALLPLGMHKMSITELRKLCVDRFDLSTTRDAIMQGLEQVVNILHAQSIKGKLWVDGSFLTEKINPHDSDVVLFVQGLFYDNATITQRQAIDFLSSDLKTTYYCDSYVSYEWPEAHLMHWEGEYWRAYWLKQWGFGRDEANGPAKGIAVITL